MHWFQFPLSLLLFAISPICCLNVITCETCVPIAAALLMYTNTGMCACVECLKYMYIRMYVPCLQCMYIHM